MNFKTIFVSVLISFFALLSYAGGWRYNSFYNGGLVPDTIFVSSNQSVTILVGFHNETGGGAPKMRDLYWKRGGESDTSLWQNSNSHGGEIVFNKIGTYTPYINGRRIAKNFVIIDTTIIYQCNVFEIEVKNHESFFDSLGLNQMACDKKIIISSIDSLLLHAKYNLEDTFNIQFQWWKDGIIFGEKTFSPNLIVKEKGVYQVTRFRYTNPSVSVLGSSLRLDVEDYIEESMEINFFPNPAQNILNLNLVEDSCSIKIYNLEGKLLLNFISENKKSTIDISSIDSGFYFLIIENQSGKRIVKKLIKE